jgi:hypothetical protein
LTIIPPQDSKRPSELSWDKRRYVQKAARSISEIQPNVNNVADVVVFLEVLGYDNNSVKRNGFSDPYELASFVYDFVDYYDHVGRVAGKQTILKSSFVNPVPSAKQRIVEGLGYASPWLGSLVILYITGFSLWMAEKLPADIIIAFIAGVFLGLIFTEGPLQVFNRLFSFYHLQSNVGEVRRVLKRNYIMIGIMLSIIISALYIVAIFANIPYELINLTAISTVTISLHRTSYMIIYALKKLRQLILAYILAFAALISIYLLVPESILPDPVIRYFVALVTSFVILSSFASYYHFKILTNSSSTPGQARSFPSFYSAITTNSRTIRSRFSVQWWDNMPYFLFGIFYFIMLFGDRVMSWIFNPETVSAINGTTLPMAFNSIYHIGADLALFILVPSAIIQFIIISPIYSLTNNKALNLKLSEYKQIDRFLRRSYLKLLIASLTVTVTTYGILNIIGPGLILYYLGGSQTSIQIMRYASIGNVLLSIFNANAMFIIFLNRAKILATITITAVIVLAGLGVIFAQSGFENIVNAYLASSATGMLLTALYVGRIMVNPGSRFFSRYV